MPGNVDAKLAAGTIFEFSVDDGTTYTAVEGIESLPAIGDESPAKDKTTISDTRMVYGTGLVDAPDLAVAGIYLKDDVNQGEFITACKAKTEMLIKITWSDGTVGEFTWQPLGFSLDTTEAGEWIKFNVPGKQNTDVTWSTVA